MIAIVKYLIIAKETDMHYWNHFETSVGALDKGNLHNYSIQGKNAICIISHGFFCTFNEPTDPVSKGNRVIQRVILCIGNRSG